MKKPNKLMGKKVVAGILTAAITMTNLPSAGVAVLAEDVIGKKPALRDVDYAGVESARLDASSKVTDIQDALSNLKLGSKSELVDGNLTSFTTDFTEIGNCLAEARTAANTVANYYVANEKSFEDTVLEDATSVSTLAESVNSDIETASDKLTELETAVEAAKAATNKVDLDAAKASASTAYDEFLTAYSSATENAAILKQKLAAYEKAVAAVEAAQQEADALGDAYSYSLDAIADLEEAKEALGNPDQKAEEILTEYYNVNGDSFYNNLNKYVETLLKWEIVPAYVANVAGNESYSVDSITLSDWESNLGNGNYIKVDVTYTIGGQSASEELFYNYHLNRNMTGNNPDKIYIVRKWKTDHVVTEGSVSTEKAYFVSNVWETVPQTVSNMDQYSQYTWENCTTYFTNFLKDKNDNKTAVVKETPAANYIGLDTVAKSASNELLSNEVATGKNVSYKYSFTEGVKVVDAKEATAKVASKEFSFWGSSWFSVVSDTKDYVAKLGRTYGNQTKTKSPSDYYYCEIDGNDCSEFYWSESKWDEFWLGFKSLFGVSIDVDVYHYTAEKSHVETQLVESKYGEINTLVESGSIDDDGYKNRGAAQSAMENVQNNLKKEYKNKGMTITFTNSKVESYKCGFLWSDTKYKYSFDYAVTVTSQNKLLSKTSYKTATYLPKNYLVDTRHDSEANWYLDEDEYFTDEQAKEVGADKKINAEYVYVSDVTNQNGYVEKSYIQSLIENSSFNGMDKLLEEVSALENILGVSYTGVSTEVTSAMELADTVDFDFDSVVDDLNDKKNDADGLLDELPDLINAEDAVVTVEDATYTGAALTPAVEVTLGEDTLVEGRDYELFYANNVNAGTGSVTVVFKDVYEGTAPITEEFTIYAISADAVTVNDDAKDYTGEEIEAVTVSYEETVLVEGTDYKITYSDNVMPGTASYSIVFLGNYEGSIDGTFEINETHNKAICFYVVKKGKTVISGLVSDSSDKYTKIGYGLANDSVLDASGLKLSGPKATDNQEVLTSVVYKQPNDDAVIAALLKAGYSNDEVTDFDLTVSFVRMILESDGYHMDCTATSTGAPYVTPEYTVNFFHNGTLVDTQTVAYATSAVAPSVDNLVPEEGYELAGWDKDFTCVKSDLDVEMTQKNLLYTVNYLFADGSLYAQSMNSLIGDTIATEINPVRLTDGVYTYTFAGWVDELGNKVEKVAGTNTEINVYATFTATRIPVIVPVGPVGPAAPAAPANVGPVGPATPAAPAAPAAPVNVAPAAPVVNILPADAPLAANDDQEEVVEKADKKTIKDASTPLASGDDEANETDTCIIHWIILCITLIAGIYFVIRVIARCKEEEEE